MAKNRLGKGLGALISDAGKEEGINPNGRYIEIYIEQIKPNPFQPRQEFQEKELRELAQSIDENGIIQPITVRHIKPESYQLIAGERRWRASQLVGLKKIPAIIRDYTDQQMMETALIENLQREDLNPIEEAQAYQRMMEEFSMTQEEVANKVGKSRSSIANIVRLLNLPSKIQMLVSRETISMGHARTILAIKDINKQIKIADYVIENNLSVRETEKYIHGLINTEKDQRKQTSIKPRRYHLEPRWIHAQQALADFLKTNVKINERNNKKVITIECNDYETIKKLLERVNSA